MLNVNEYIQKVLYRDHPRIAQYICNEDIRQNMNIELIASENFPSDAVRIAASCSMVAKYAEGYPGKRYYGGCTNVDQLEDYCEIQWSKVFDANNYHVNVQPHSGSQANYAAYMALCNPSDTILSMNLDNGGHLTHGSTVNFSGKLYNFIHYDVTSDGVIDYDNIAYILKNQQPNVILMGASAYSRIIDFEKVYEYIQRYSPNTKFMVDMSHVAGLIAAGYHPSPFGLADVITTTTHKTLRGTRGGIIFCKKEYAKAVDNAIFPGSQGGPLEHIIAAKAVTAEETLTPEFKKYIKHVVDNSRAMCEEFINMGYDVVSGGTDNHLFLLDFSRTHPNLTGKMIQDELDRHNITVNKNCVPGEKRSPFQTSGIRVGTAAMTTKGYDASDFVQVAHKMDEIISMLNSSIN